MSKSKLNYNHVCQKSNYCILMIPVCNSVQSRPISRQRGIHDWWVQISVSVQWIDIMCDHVFCWLFQEKINRMSKETRYAMYFISFMMSVKTWYKIYTMVTSELEKVHLRNRGRSCTVAACSGVEFRNES